MKKLLLFVFTLLIFQNFSAQENKNRPFFEGTFKLTFAINENFTLDPDDDETFLIPTATFFRFGVGYQFGKKFSLSLNAGYDHHFPYAINAFPTYVTARYNLWGDIEGSFFTQFSRGKMWRPSSRFEDGDYYNFGIGWQLFADSRWKPVIKILYHRKKIRGFEESGNLESISLGIGFRFL